MVCERIRIGRWVFDSSLNTLSDATVVVHVEPKVADLLGVLAARAGQVVGRSELLEAVWPGVVVGDEALSQSVNKLRRALGDTSREPTYLQTVPKRGYRLIAAVAPLSAADTVIDARPATEEVIDARPAAARLTPVSERPRRRASLRLAAGSALLLVALAATLLVSRHFLQTSDDLAALVGAKRPVAALPGPPELLMRRFDAIGDTEQTRGYARALWQLLAADVSRSRELRVILDDRDRPPQDANLSALTQLQARATVPLPTPVPAQRYQLDGTVQLLPDQRAALHLVLSRPVSGRVVWSRRAELALPDLLRGRDPAATDLLDALTVTLSQAERERLSRPYTISLVAFQHFLQGQAAFGARDRQGNADARRQFELAAAADPSFARAHASVGLTHAADASFGWTAGREHAIAQAIAHAQRAASLDGQLPEVHWVLAWVQAQRRQHSQALHHLRRAVELNPSYADAYALAASVATYVGRPEEAIDLMRVAMQLRPVPGYLYYLIMGRAHFQLGDYAQSAAYLAASVERNSALLESRLYLAAAMQRSGAIDEAEWQVQEILTLAPGFVVDAWIASGLSTDRRTLSTLANALASLGLRRTP